jgi:type IX secretion system PorP/SprF family membrane protein
MKTYKIFLFIAVVCSGITGFSQQDPQFSQNMHNKLYPNPAVAGSNQAICLTLLGRYQWLQFDGNPETYLLSVHGPVNLLKQNFGVGLSVTKDRLGSQSSLGAKGALAWRKGLGNGTVGVGVGLGMINVALDPFSEGDAIDGIAGDPSINAASVSDIGFDMDLGLYYHADKLYVGFSSTHITQSELKNTNLSYNVARHYYVMAGYNAELNPNFVIQPSVLAKSDATSTQFELNMMLVYKQQMWAGMSYRVSDAIAPMIGVNWPLGNGNIKFGYAYDITLSLLKSYSAGSHELMLGYCFDINDKNKVERHKTVRFL